MDVTVAAANSLDGKCALYRGGPAQTLAITIAPVADRLTLLAPSELAVVFPKGSPPVSVTVGSQGAWSPPAGDKSGAWELAGADGAEWDRTEPLVLTVSGLDPGGLAASTLDVTVRATLRSAFDQKTVALTVPVVDYGDRDLSDLDVTFAIVGRQGVELASGQRSSLTFSITNAAVAPAASPTVAGAMPTLILQALVADKEGVGGVLGAWANVGQGEAAIRAQPGGGDWRVSGETPTHTDGRAAWTFTPPSGFLPAGGVVQIGLDHLLLDATLPVDLPDTTPIILSWSHVPGRRDGVAVLILGRRDAVPFVKLAVDPVAVEAPAAVALSWESYAVPKMSIVRDGVELGRFAGDAAVSTTGFPVDIAWNGTPSQTVTFTLQALDATDAPLPVSGPGTVSAPAELTVLPRMPKIVAFTASPSPCLAGDPVTLSWSIDPPLGMARLSTLGSPSAFDPDGEPCVDNADSCRIVSSVSATRTYRIIAAKNAPDLDAARLAGRTTSDSTCAVSLCTVQTLADYLVGRSYMRFETIMMNNISHGLTSKINLKRDLDGRCTVTFTSVDSSSQPVPSQSATGKWSLDGGQLNLVGSNWGLGFTWNRLNDTLEGIFTGPPFGSTWVHC